MVRVESVYRWMELCRSVDWMDAMLLLLLLLDVADGSGRLVVEEEQSGEITTTPPPPLELVEEASSSSDSEVGYSLAASGAGCCGCDSIVAQASITILSSIHRRHSKKREVLYVL